MQDQFASSRPGELNGAGKRVLIVEDESIIAFALEDMLAELGFTVVAIAGDVDQSLKLIDETSPDLVVLDVNLHGAKSYPVADVLEERGMNYVFATGYGDELHPERHRDAPTISKPYSPDQLKAAFAELGS